LQAPQLNNLVKEQLRRKEKDPQFGAERTLYKVQEKLLVYSISLINVCRRRANTSANAASESTGGIGEHFPWDFSRKAQDRV